MSEENEINLVKLTISDAEGASATVEVHPEVAKALLECKAQPLIYCGTPGEDPEQHYDSFAVARCRMMNAIHELQAASQVHPIMDQREQPLAFARHIAEQQCILTFNMLGQAGLLESRARERQAQMQQMAEEKSIHLPGGGEVKVGKQ